MKPLLIIFALAFTTPGFADEDDKPVNSNDIQRSFIKVRDKVKHELGIVGDNVEKFLKEGRGDSKKESSKHKDRDKELAEMKKELLELKKQVNDQIDAQLKRLEK